PSEVAPATAALLTEWLPKVLDPTAVKVINGGVAETTAVLKERFDHIFYTGNGHVGKIIMSAAAKNLTPVVLELGGKSPVYIHGDANPALAVRRILWAKTFNNGQTCIAPDYILVQKSIAPAIYAEFQKQLTALYPDGAQKVETYSRIINSNHFKRLEKVLHRQQALSHTKIIYGGQTDGEDLYIAPTIFTGVKFEDPVMEDELFGPLLGIVEVDSEDAAIKYINSRDRPLALYVFANTKTAKKIIDNTNSGAAIVNDLFMNMLIPEMPFGGVGPSGMGAYHGKNGFLTFTHRRATMWRPKGLEALNEVRYAPFHNTKVARQMADVLLRVRPSPAWQRFLGNIITRFGGYALLAAVAFVVGRRSAGTCVTSWLEASWLGYHAVASTLIGLANVTLPMAVMTSHVGNRGGGSIPKLFETTLEALESAEKAELNNISTQSTPTPPAPVSSSPYSAAVSGIATQTQTQITQALASDRLATARENLDTMAALLATTLFQIQYLLGADAMIAFLCVHALRPSTPDGERRLVHKTLGLVKSCQYFVYFLHEGFTADGFTFGPGTLVNLFGLGVSAAASYWWGCRKVVKEVTNGNGKGKAVKK
ncbi:aldehyde dehydrogenase 3, member A2, partial [Blyttiomyces sp. JEL0837]